MSDKVDQICDELWSVIKRHKYENRVKVYHVIAALEAVKFEVLMQAFEEAEEKEGDCG